VCKFLLIPEEKQIELWGKIEVFFFASNIGLNNIVALHTDMGNAPMTVSVTKPYTRLCSKLNNFKQATINCYFAKAGVAGRQPIGGEYGLPFFNVAFEVCFYLPIANYYLRFIISTMTRPY
jgi:hypothetical protein